MNTPENDPAVTHLRQANRPDTELERFFNLSPDLLATASLEDACWKRINPAFTRILGWSEQELLTTPFLNLIHADDLDRSLQAMNRLPSGEPLTLFENRVICKNGSFRWIAWEIQIDNDKDRVYASGRDVTDRKIAEEKLRESEARYRSLFTHMTEAFALGEVIFDEAGQPADFRFLQFNEAFTIQTGLGPEVLDHPITHALPGLEEHWIQTYGRVALTGEPAKFENYNRHTDRHYQVYAYSPAQGQFAIVFRDVTEEKRSEQALRESEDRFRTMADGLPLIVWVHDAEGRLQFINRTYCEFFGITEETILDAGWRVLVHPENTDYITRFTTCVRDRIPFSAEARVRRADGNWRWIESWARPRFSDSGKFLGYVGTSVDITDRQEAQKSLQLSREALRKSNEQLEQRVKERTADLRRSIEVLREEIRQREHAEAELSQLNTELNMRMRQLRKMAGELTLAEQRERKRLSGVLHDGLQQYLVSAKVQLETLLKKAPDDRFREVGSGISEILSESIRVTRSLSAELNPPALHEEGLHGGLEWLVRWMRDTHDFTVDLSLEGRLNMSEDIRILLYESVRELLFNAVKHAGVSRAEVSLARTDGEIRITIRDEGKGFSPDTLVKSRNNDGGQGLFSIRERISFLGGRFDIDSAPGKGCRFSLQIPESLKTSKTRRK